MISRLHVMAAAALLAAGTAAMSIVSARDEPAAPAAFARESRIPPEVRSVDSTVSVRGRLAPASRGWIRTHGRGGRALVVVLRRGDVAVCEDLGRQLREVIRAAGGRIPGLVVIDRGANEEIAGFLRREHLHLPIEVGSPDSLLAGGLPLATPAVLVVRDGDVAEGVAHPVRFANLRVSSFAAELSPLLPRLTAPRANAAER